MKKIADVLLNAATKFELEVMAQLAEADSTLVTLTVRPIINNLMDKMKVSDKLNNILTVASNKNLTGNVAIGGSSFITNAKKVGNKWVIDPVTSSFPYSIDGELANDQGVNKQVQMLVNSLKNTIITTLNNEFNRVNIPGDIITDHSTSVDEKSGGI
jgi:hypothetical protein